MNPSLAASGSKLPCAQLDWPRKVANRVSEAVYDTIPIPDHRGSQAFPQIIRLSVRYRAIVSAERCELNHAVRCHKAQPL